MDFRVRPMSCARTLNTEGLIVCIAGLLALSPSLARSLARWLNVAMPRPDRQPIPQLSSRRRRQGAKQEGKGRDGDRQRQTHLHYGTHQAKIISRVGLSSEAETDRAKQRL